MTDRLPHEKGFHISWDQLHRDSRALAWRLDGKGPDDGAWKAVVAITRGGMAPAMIVARELDAETVVFDLLFGIAAARRVERGLIRRRGRAGAEQGERCNRSGKSEFWHLEEPPAHMDTQDIWVLKPEHQLNHTVGRTVWDDDNVTFHLRSGWDGSRVYSLGNQEDADEHCIQAARLDRRSKFDRHHCVRWKQRWWQCAATTSKPCSGFQQRDQYLGR